MISGLFLFRLPSATFFKASFLFSALPLVAICLTLCICLSQVLVFQDLELFSYVTLLPWLIGLVFVGLPHGATDLCVLAHARSKYETIFLFAIYSLVALCVFALLVIWPSLIVSLFLLVSMWHFGNTSMMAWQGHERAFKRSGWSWLARSGVVLGMPLFAHPIATKSVVSGITQCVNPVRGIFHLGAIDSPAFSADAVHWVGTCILLLGVGVWVVEGIQSVCRFRAHNDRSELMLFTKELLVFALFACLGWCAPPLLSVGTFFLWWHSWREIPEIAASLSPNSLCSTEDFSGWPSVRLIHEAALPLLIPSWILMFLMWWWLAPAHSFYYLVMVSLIFYLIVTPSHEWLAQVLNSQSCRRT